MNTENNQTQEAEKMHYEIENLKKEITKLKADFNVEKNAKNESYAFILSNNLLEKFADFSRNNKGKDPHSLCLSALGMTK